VRVGVAYLSWTDTDMVRAANEDEVALALRRRLPGPARRTYPLASAAARIAAGIERRSAHVYAQPWVRATQVVRGALPPLIAATAGRELRRLAATPLARRGLLGPGGAAAERSGQGERPPQKR
jgi:hypothetical protein